MHKYINIITKARPTPDVVTNTTAYRALQYIHTYIQNTYTQTHTHTSAAINC